MNVYAEVNATKERRREKREIVKGKGGPASKKYRTSRSTTAGSRKGQVKEIPSSVERLRSNRFLKRCLLIRKKTFYVPVKFLCAALA